VGAAAGLAGLPLYIDDTPALSITALRACARRMKRQHGIGLIVVHYLQLMTAPGRRNDHNRVQEISAISQGLKQVARELDVSVLAASQLSRSVVSGDNKRPQLDLRESGSIEQDADVALFLVPPECYLSRQAGAAESNDPKAMDVGDQLEKARGVTELIISKNRKGPTDTVRLMFEPQTTTFRGIRQGRLEGHTHLHRASYHSLRCPLPRTNLS
jgi:replicative DNA helicase